MQLRSGRSALRGFALLSAALLCSARLCFPGLCSSLLGSELLGSARLGFVPLCSALLCSVRLCSSLLGSVLPSSALLGTRLCTALLTTALPSSALHGSALLCTAPLTYHSFRHGMTIVMGSCTCRVVAMFFFFAPPGSAQPSLAVIRFCYGIVPLPAPLCSLLCSYSTVSALIVLRSARPDLWNPDL